jgi:transposase-like protein
VGLTVEVDESLVFKRKSHCGRLLANERDEIWIVGGICRETGDAFIVPVQDRSALTLLEVIRDNVVSNTRVFTDYWSAYSQLSSEGYPHSRVNHTYNFLNPEDKNVHTQKIERMWRTLKSIIPKGCNSETRWTYLAEFIFKQKNKWFSLSPGERLHLILRKIKEIKFN